MRFLFFIFLFCFSTLVLAQSTKVYKEMETGNYYSALELKNVSGSVVKTYKMVFPNKTTNFEVNVVEEII